MKQKLIISSLLLGALLSFSACGQAAAPSSSTPPISSSLPAASEPAPTPESEVEPLQETIYRGEVTSLEEGIFTVTQLPGHDYGQATIQFHYDENTPLESEIPLQEGSFVQVTYNGLLTRSMPGQGTAESILVVAPYVEGILVNGSVVEMQPADNGDYRITLLPFEAEAQGEAGYVILMVPKTALEGLAEEDLAPGAEVCAVTTGIAALSQPPQMPVLALLPYTEAAA